jgi:signal transduction histidine kinase
VRRLYSRIYIHLLGVLLVVGLAVTLLVTFGQRGAFQRHFLERFVAHIGSLAAERWDDGPALRRRLDQVSRDLGVRLTVRGADGELVAAAGPPLQPLSPSERARLRQGEVLHRHRPGWLAAAPVRDPVSRAFLGFVELSAPPPMQLVALWRPGLAVVVVLAVVALAAAPLARRISRPVERLTEAVQRLGAGELSVRVPVHGPWRGHRRRRRLAVGRHQDELETLTRAFNEMAERLERLVEGQKELLANVSHELRSPLARVRLALALLPREGEADARLRDVETDLAELERLIDDVLTTSRLGMNRLPPHPAPLEARALLAEIAERARHDPLTAGQAVVVAAGPPVEVRADAALLRRALWNLVENAAKYGAPPIVLAVERSGATVTLSVSDAGAGIRPEERERVLEPFYRADRARTPPAAGEAPRGFGLGLTLTRRVAEVHGGRIVIEPATRDGDREHGCRVSLRLPAP